jgi:hypothetical protein
VLAPATHASPFLLAFSSSDTSTVVTFREKRDLIFIFVRLFLQTHPQQRCAARVWRE